MLVLVIVMAMAVKLTLPPSGLYMTDGCHVVTLSHCHLVVAMAAAAGRPPPDMVRVWWAMYCRSVIAARPGSIVPARRRCAVGSPGGSAVAVAQSCSSASSTDRARRSSIPSSVVFSCKNVENAATSWTSWHPAAGAEAGAALG